MENGYKINIDMFSLCFVALSQCCLKFPQKVALIHWRKIRSVSSTCIKCYNIKWAQNKYMVIFFHVFCHGHKISSLSLEGTNKVCDGHTIST